MGERVTVRSFPLARPRRNGATRGKQVAGARFGYAVRRSAAGALQLYSYVWASTSSYRVNLSLCTVISYH